MPGYPNMRVSDLFHVLYVRSNDPQRKDNHGFVYVNLATYLVNQAGRLSLAGKLVEIALVPKRQYA